MLIDGGDGVGGNRDLEVAHVRVEGAVENALLGHLAAEDEVVNTSPFAEEFQSP